MTVPSWRRPIVGRCGGGSAPGRLIAAGYPGHRLCVFRGSRREITITVPPELLDKVDRVASGVGQTRTSFINTCLWRAVEYGISIDGLGRRNDRD